LVEGDLFGPEIVLAGGVLNGEAIDRAYAVMALCPYAMFLLPTGWPKRMTKWFREQDEKPLWGSLNHLFWYAQIATGSTSISREVIDSWRWPLPNVIPAITLSTQADGDRLVPDLLRVPAGRLGRAVVLRATEAIDLHDGTGERAADGWLHRPWYSNPASKNPIGWVVLEPIQNKDKAKVHIWAREYPGILRDQCRAAGVPLWSAVPIGGEWVREFPEGVNMP
jgi:hypothetical protein